MRPFLPLSLVVLGVLGVLGPSALALGCDRAPSPDGLKEWKPEDHDGDKRQPAANQGPKGASNTGGIAQLVDIAWKNQCQSCHGPSGHGDGPQGVMVKAADLGREDWQAAVKDEEIAAIIKNGKGRMPKFELPEELVKGLVGRVRSFRGK